MVRLGLIVALALTAGACGKGSSSSELDAFMKLDTEKAAAFNAGGDDCAAKAKTVGDWRKANTAKYNEMRGKLKELWRKGPPKELQDKYGEQMKANKKAVMSVMLKCSNDPAFSKMMDETKSAD